MDGWMDGWMDGATSVQTDGMIPPARETPPMFKVSFLDTSNMPAYLFCLYNRILLVMVSPLVSLYIKPQKGTLKARTHTCCCLFEVTFVRLGLKEPTGNKKLNSNFVVVKIPNFWLFRDSTVKELLVILGNPVLENASRRTPRLVPRHNLQVLFCS